MKGNYLLLTDKQLKVFNEKYIFTKGENGILVKTANYDRIVYHTFEDSFPAIAVIDDKKYTFKITSRAIKLWLEDSSHSLIDIQNAINKTYISSQNISDEMIKENLK